MRGALELAAFCVNDVAISDDTVVVCAIGRQRLLLLHARRVMMNSAQALELCCALATDAYGYGVGRRVVA